MKANLEPMWLDRVLIEGHRLMLCTSQKMFDDTWKFLETDGRPCDYVSDGCSATHHSFVSDKHGVVSVVCINLEKAAKKEGVQIAALLVHEAVHVWRRFREGIGEREPSSEFEAYSIQAISQALMYEYARHAA